MPNAPPLIAVVDDEESVRKALQRLIRSAGFAVETFPSGGEFLRSVQDHHPACVVLDLHMPNVSGFDVQAELARTGEQVPVVVITGHDTPEARARVIGQGAKAYLRKPVDDLMLLAAINEAIAGNPEPSQNAGLGPKGNGA
jgi:FixJ family two-component response regulator